jgi:hypothetical protein
VRLFLDAHVSGPRIAAALRESGHEVRAAGEERELDSMGDEELLALASAEGRVTVTFDVKDFPDIARRWAKAGRSHAGLAMVVGIDHGEFGAILRVLEGLFAERGDAEGWRDRTLFIPRSGPASPSTSAGRCSPRGRATS